MSHLTEDRWRENEELRTENAWLKARDAERLAEIERLKKKVNRMVRSASLEDIQGVQRA